jgi:hypothetical protein
MKELQNYRNDKELLEAVTAMSDKQLSRAEWELVYKKMTGYDLTPKSQYKTKEDVRRAIIQRLLSFSRSLTFGGRKLEDSTKFVNNLRGDGR